MGKTYRRFSTEFKLQLVEAYLAGEGSMKGVATKAGIEHSLLYYWIEKYRAGALSVELQREEELIESAQHISALERKVGQLTMEIELLKRGLLHVPVTSSARSSISSGPAAPVPEPGAR